MIRDFDTETGVIRVVYPPTAEYRLPQLARIQTGRTVAERQTRPQDRPVRRLIGCPDCAGTLVLTPVNISRCTNIGGPWQTSMVCNNSDCRYTDLSVRSIREIQSNGI